LEGIPAVRSFVPIAYGILAAYLGFSASAQTSTKSTQPPNAANATFPAKGNLGTASRISLYFGDVERYYLVQPASGEDQRPVVIFLHGGTEDAEQAWRQTSLPTLAAQNNFTFVVPNALIRHWNDGRGAVLSGKPSTADDIGFLREVIENVLRDHNGDPHAVFMIGASNGGFMTMHFACSGGYPLHAAANAISDLPIDQQQSCRAPQIPWLSMNGTDDPLVPFAGMKPGTVIHGEAQPALLSADDTFRFFALRAGCQPVLKGQRLPHRNPVDPTHVEMRTCTGNGGIASLQYVFQGGGHSLPNLKYGPLVQKIVGRSNQDVDAGQIIWDFFKSTM
jgi:polyhydroxybutyrate depolymerase